ncbi:MAG: SDR family oxidoreductase [Polyangiaceae bacterium]|nr:SDR family oxidoreductase [Polyangiaceae bacterium]
MKIQDSVALVTGANRGLGLAFVERLLERGAKKVYAGARDPSSVRLAGVIPVALDVTQPGSIERLAAELGDVTLLVNNAGVSRGKGALAEGAVARAREEIETNYLGPLATSQAFAPILAKNGGGAILNVLSVLSWVTLPTSTTYSASKAAAWAVTNGLRNELAAQRTQVVGLHVGYIDTDMAHHVSGPKTSPEEVVRRALDALESGDTEVLIDDVSKQVKQGLSGGVYLHPVPAR